MTSESILNIQKQPTDFCPFINPSIELYKELLDYVYEVEDYYLDSNFKEFKLNDFKNINKIEEDKQAPMFDQLIEEMSGWSKQWLFHFEKSIEKEKHELLKHRLNQEVKHFQIQVNNFKENAAFFKTQQAKLHEMINCKVDKIYEEFNNKSSHDSSKYHNSLVSMANEDLKSELMNIIDLYEFLRTSASSIRSCLNDDLKTKAKIQLYRVNYLKELTKYLKDKSHSGINYYFESHREDIMRIDRLYF